MNLHELPSVVNIRILRPEVGYVQGMSYLAAMLLLYMESYEAFTCLANMLAKDVYFQFYRLQREVERSSIVRMTERKYSPAGDYSARHRVRSLLPRKPPVALPTYASASWKPLCTRTNYVAGRRSQV
jgi:hypothetical protein